MKLTIDDIIRLSRLPRPVDERLWGRDESNPYYDFLYHLTRRMEPNLVVELGTCEGGSAAHFACGGAKKIVSIDIAQRPDAVAKLQAFNSVECWEADSLSPATGERMASLGLIDLLFIDTLHTREQVSAEFECYQGFVASTGVILFDDITIDEGMSHWWNELGGKKVSLPWLHRSGFGALLR